jgi:hypothetical protein
MLQSECLCFWCKHIQNHKYRCYSVYDIQQLLRKTVHGVTSRKQYV